jgi:hypothetical protein
MLTFKQLGRYGRLGNQMSQIAGTIGIAHKCGHGFGFPKWRNYDALERFGTDEDIEVHEWFANPLPDVVDAHYITHNVPWGYHETSVPDWTNLQGHMQSERYFQHCEHLIRYYFEFKHKSKPLKDTLAIHFRGGDYGGNYHPHCTPEYYAKAIEQFDCKRILVFSDDIKLAKQRITAEAEFVEGNHTMVDLELMSQCDHHIIANSTFSWWGAWLGQSKKVVAPRRWFGPEARINGNDLYCKDWIIL